MARVDPWYLDRLIKSYHRDRSSHPCGTKEQRVVSLETVVFHSEDSKFQDIIAGYDFRICRMCGQILRIKRVK